jgi:hypothetical protein
MPDDGLVGSAASRFVGVADGAAFSDDGALCWTVEPADGASRPGPLRAGETGPGDQRRRRYRHHKTISHGISPRVFALPTPTTKGDLRCSAKSAVPPDLFCECSMNTLRRKDGANKRPAKPSALQSADAQFKR